MSGSRLQNHICQLPNPQFPDRDFTAKNIRGFISNTKTPNSSDRYPETPKRAHWISAQRVHNSSQTLKHNWDHNHTHCDKDPPNRPKSSTERNENCTDTSHHGDWLPNHWDTYRPNTKPPKQKDRSFNNPRTSYNLKIKFPDKWKTCNLCIDPQAADSLHLYTDPSLKQHRGITTLDPESKAQWSHILGCRRLHRDLSPRDWKASKLQRCTSRYTGTHPRGFVLWLTKSAQIKYPITHNPAKRLKGIKCTQTTPVLSHEAIHNPKLPDTVYFPGRDTKLRDLSLDMNCMHFCE